MSDYPTKLLRRSLVAAVAVILLGADFLHAQVPKLPETLTFTAYDTGTSGFNITVAVGKGLKDKFNTQVRVLPAGNDVARLAPLRADRAQIAAMGVGTYFAQEAVFEFGAREWGPQPLRLLMSSVDCNGAALGVARDTGVSELKGLKGKRVGFVVGSPALNQNALAMLAFADLKREDVKIVEFASYGAMWKGMVNDEVDAAFGSTITGPAKEVETSPRGLVWPLVPHADKAGWERLRKIGPFFTQHVATCGAAGISPQTPKELANFPYPLFSVLGSMTEDQAYAITRGMIDSYDIYKDGAPGASGLAIKQQTTQWVIPFHAGAVKAFKEAGIWKDADEANNQALLSRQKVLGEAWTAFSTASPPDDKAAFAKGWSAARKAALAKAGMDAVIE